MDNKTVQAPDDRIVAARRQMPLALALEGFVVDGRPACPDCHRADVGRNKLFEDGGFKCHGCGFYVANAVDLLTRSRVRARSTNRVIGTAESVNAGVVKVRIGAERHEDHPESAVSIEGGLWSFRDALDALSGGEIRHPDGAVPEIPVLEVKRQFTAVPNPELYRAVLDLGSVEAAQEFYGRWHISPEVVASSRAVRIVDQRRLLRDLSATFGPDELVRAGLATEEGYLLVNQRYPVIEPHLLPDGRVAGMQFRGSEETERLVAAHKAYKVAKESVEARGEKYTGDKAKHVPKFMSLNGASPASRCGFNLPEIAAAAKSGSHRRVWLVEGFKDVLAGAELGMLCYGLPGAGLLPVRAVCALLSQFDVRVALDGDAAGAAGRERLLKHLARFGITATEKAPPVGMDICDVLVAKKTAVS
jgi:hypothetical protein